MQFTPTLKRFGLAGIFVAEVVAIAAVAYAGSGLEAEAVRVGRDAVVIKVSDQRVFGAYSIDRVVSPVDGYVVLRADNGDGVPAELIGAAPVKAGENLNVAVVADRNAGIPAGAFASLVADRGTLGKFEYNTGSADDSTALGDAGGMMGGPVGPPPEPMDWPLVADDEVVSERFDVTPFPAVYPMADANIVSAMFNAPHTSVEARGIDAPEDSWVVVIRGAVGAGEQNAVLGATRVPAGHTDRLTIPLDEAPPTTQVTALLVCDLGTKGVLEVDPINPQRSVDAPYVVLSYYVWIGVSSAQ